MSGFPRSNETWMGINMELGIMVGILFAVALYAAYQRKKDKDEPEVVTPIPVIEPEPKAQFVWDGTPWIIIDTDFNGHPYDSRHEVEQDNAQWLMVRNSFARKLLFYVVTGMEKYSGIDKLTAFVNDNPQVEQAPVYEGVRSDVFEAVNMDGVNKTIEALEAVPSGQTLDYIVGGYQYNLIGIVRKLKLTGRTHLLNKMRVFCIYEQWVGGTNDPIKNELNNLPFAAFYVDNYGFRASTLARQSDASRTALHNWLLNESPIKDLYAKYQIWQTDFDFKAGDYVIELYSRGKYLDIFKHSGRGANYYVVDEGDMNAFNRMANEWESIKAEIIRTVSNK